MAIDKGYGSGKPRSAANSSMRRRAAAGQMTKGKKKMGQLGSYKTPGLEAANRRTSDSLLEAFTGFNKKDGVDAGDFAGLAISIPTGGLSGIARAVGRAVVPKAARIAGAATRASRAAKRTIATASGDLSAAEFRQSLGRQYVNAADADSRKLLSGFNNEYTSRGYGAFDENLGTELTRTTEYGGGIRSGEDMVRRGLAKRVETPSGAAYYSTALQETGKIGSSMISEATKLRGRSAARIALAEQRATAKAAGAEIRRRLSSIRKAKEAEKKAPKTNNPKKPLDWGAL
jgi:hypothetical protein